MRPNCLMTLDALIAFLCIVLSESTFIASVIKGRTKSTSLWETGSGRMSNCAVETTTPHEVSPRTARIETPLGALVLSFAGPSTPMPASANDISFQSTMQKYFPKALPTSVVCQKVRSALSERQFTRTNTLFGTSISPDEINTKPQESLSAVLEEYMSKNGGVYCLGGLGGLPSMGMRGLSEFLSHSPRKGKVFILYGPNIGISDNGTLGMIERLGQKSLSECCEPGLNTFETIQTQIKVDKEKAATSEATSQQYSDVDSQMDFILQNMEKYVDTPQASLVGKADAPAFITLKMFQLGKDMITEQLEACLADEARREVIMEVALLGGVIINRGQVLGSIEPREDYFLPLVFESYTGDLDLEGNLEKEDLFSATFGAVSSLGMT